MKAQTFVKKLRKIIENDGKFVTNAINMQEVRQHVKDFGFDDVIHIAGENEKEVFSLCVKKIE